MEMLLHIYFCTHFSDLNVLVITSVEEKFRDSCYFVSFPFATKSITEPEFQT